MPTLEARVAMLEAATVTHSVDVIHLVGMGKRCSEIRRAQVSGLTFDRADDETERSFLARVKAHIPAHQQRVILAF